MWSSNGASGAGAGAIETSSMWEIVAQTGSKG
jgi:hypothetical protein